MSWLRGAPLRASLSRAMAPSRAIAAPAAPSPDPSAAFDSFCKHWQQAHDIILRTQDNGVPSHDDVLGVVSHLEHLVTLLLLEIRNSPSSQDDEISKLSFGAGGVCLERLISESILDKLFEWGSSAGRYVNAVRLEQLKLYSLLMTHSGQQLLSAEPFLRPLLKLLCSFKSELLPEEVEGRLVCLLGQLCVVLMQKSQLVDLFFYPSSQDNNHNISFVPVMLLMSFVHREGSLGQQARAALLLCAALSARNEAVADYISRRSNVCPLLATGLSGLYSLLPRNIVITQADWHRLTPDDVNEINKLGLFMNSLEFCNDVAQVSHSSIRCQLLDFFYQGFLLPVMGPALLQKKRGQTTTRPHCLQSGVDEQIAAIAYLELALRSVSEPGLLKSLIKFLLDKNYDGANILDTIVPFVNADPRLSIVTISLLETLIDLNCEDLMIELVLKYLINGNHLMVSHLNKSLDCDIYCKATNMFLSLSPECFAYRPLSSNMKRNNNSRKTSVSSLDQNMSSLSSISEQGSSPVNKNIPSTNFAYGLNANESLYGNYHAYLCDARRKILSNKKSCSKWSSRYDSYNNGFSNIVSKKSLDNLTEYSNNAKLSVPNDCVVPDIEVSNANAFTNKEEDSLHSIGESSGYESFKYRGDDVHNVDNESASNEDESKDFAEDAFWRTEKIFNVSSHANVKNELSNDSYSAQLNEVNIGPLLSTCLNKLSNMLNNNIYVNLRLTGLITRLATYPLPILRSFLLSPWIVLQPAITSLYQILVTLKQQIDESVQNETECLRLLEEAQSYLIDREIRLANTRKNAIESAGSKNQNSSDLSKTAMLSAQLVHYSNNEDGSSSAHNSGSWDQQQPSSIQPMTIYDPFKRNEPNRRSISSSFKSMFAKKLNAGGITTSPNASLQPQESQTQSASDTLSLSSMSEDNLWHSTAPRRIILNALILDEWLKEIGALAQEHVVCAISDISQESSDSMYAQSKFL